MWPAIIAAAGSVLGGIVGNRGVRSANASNQAMSSAQAVFNAEQAQKNRVFQSNQAQRQMDFQRQSVATKMKYDTQMANTAVERRMNDLQRSGVNPILAGRYDADSPSAAALSGASGSGSQAAPYTILPSQNEMAPLAHSASSLLPDLVALQRALVDTDNAKKTGGLIEAQTQAATQGARLSERQGDMTLRQMQKLDAERDKLRAEIPKIESETERTKAEKRLREIEITLKSKGVPRAEMENKALSSVQLLVDAVLEKMRPAVTSTAKGVKDFDPSRGRPRSYGYRH